MRAAAAKILVYILGITMVTVGTVCLVFASLADVVKFYHLLSLSGVISTVGCRYFILN